MGPWPRTTQTSPGFGATARMPFRHVFTGSTKLACSKRHALVRDLLNAALYDPVHDAYILRESAARRFKSRSDTDFLVYRALREQIVLTVKALTARNVMKHDHTITGLETLITPSPTAATVPAVSCRINTRWRQKHRKRSSSDPVGQMPQVSDANQNFARVDVWDGNLLYDNGARAAINGGGHCSFLCGPSERSL